MPDRHPPGTVRDAIVEFLGHRDQATSVNDICGAVSTQLGVAAASSIRSYLRLNTPGTFERTKRAFYRLARQGIPDLHSYSPVENHDIFSHGQATLHHDDCMNWIRRQPVNSVHAVVTDPPYGLVEYSEKEQAKLRNAKGGVWRIPPSFDGCQRAPLPRFTTLGDDELGALRLFFKEWAVSLLPVLVPGAHVFVASNPLLSYIVAGALCEAGFERRGEIIRLVMTMRGGDRPKNAHEKYPDVSVMPRSMWEPWLLFRKRIEGRVQDNLRRWGAGALRRPNREQPFGDVIRSSPTRKQERGLAPHPSLKPQSFLRQIVRASLPLGSGIVLDPFAGSGSTLAAANAVGYRSVGVEKDKHYFNVARSGIARLSNYDLSSSSTNGLFK